MIVNILTKRGLFYHVYQHVDKETAYFCFCKSVFTGGVTGFLVGL